MKDYNEKSNVVIAFIIPVTSKTRKDENLADTPFVKIFLRSLVRSIEGERYLFRIYLGCDKGDLLYDVDSAKETLRSLIRSELSKVEPSRQPKLSLEELFTFSDTTNNPCLVWNRLFRSAFDDKCDFFYQCGDDIDFIDSGWAEKFIKGLASIDSTMIGITGPFDVRNPRILTQSFVSKTHMDIFGYYFPNAITNLFCDDWITLVYSPNHIHRLGEEDGARVCNTPAPSDCPVVRYSPALISASQLEILVQEGKRLLARHVAYN